MVVFVPFPWPKLKVFWKFWAGKPGVGGKPPRVCSPSGLGEPE